MQDQDSPNRPVVLPPAALNTEEPDEFTQTGPLFIPNGAPHQVFRFCRWGVEYGTDDKGHAASIILSVTLLALLMALFAIGAFVDRPWIVEALKLIGTAFTFTAGVAIGKGSSSSKSKGD